MATMPVKEGDSQNVDLSEIFKCIEEKKESFRQSSIVDSAVNDSSRSQPNEISDERGIASPSSFSTSQSSFSSRQLGVEHTNEVDCTGNIAVESELSSADPLPSLQSAEQERIPPYDLGSSPHLIANIESPFKEPGNFTKGCKWSPDGLCILTCSEDSRLRIFNTPTELLTASSQHDSVSWPAEAAVESHAGELVYDYCWYPLMNSLDPASCCFASTCRDHPIHLYDAFSGDLRATYRAYNNVDEVSAAYSLAFDSGGHMLYAGFNGWLAEFNVATPGRQITSRCLKDKHSAASLSGIVSCFAFCAAFPTIHAVATYRRSIGIFSSTDSRRPLCVLDGQNCGVTHMQISPDGRRLFSGGRRDSEILCWDLRHLGRLLCVMRRTVDTNQRIYFDIGAHHYHNQQQHTDILFSGDSSGLVRAWNVDKLTSCHDDVTTDKCATFDAQMTFAAHSDCCNGVSCHPYLPVLATSSGQRHHVTAAPRHVTSSCTSGTDSDTSTESVFGSVHSQLAVRDRVVPENSVKLWSLGGMNA